MPVYVTLETEQSEWIERHEPTVYSDGSVTLAFANLDSADPTLVVRFSLPELVAFAMTAPREDE